MGGEFLAKERKKMEGWGDNQTGLKWSIKIATI